MSRPDETLPSDVDVIVLGTGLPESILAAACARVGFTVLHLDRNEYYGGSWASFNLDGILKWVEEQKNGSQSPASASSATPPEIQLQEGERLFPVVSSTEPTDPGVHYSNLVVQWHVPASQRSTDSGSATDEEPPATPSSSPTDKPEEREESEAKTAVEPKLDEQAQKLAEVKTEVQSADEAASMKVKEKKSQEWTRDRIMNDWRRFSLDLSPKILLGRGSMVELLSQSNVGRYAEFRSVNRLLTFYDGSLKVIPCSRSEVFQSTEITMIEKRMLMKFLTFCLNYDSETERPKWQDFAERSFTDFLTSPDQQLTERLRHYILHALAMVSPTTKTSEALRSINEFLMSTGRYGSSPFLWTLYGSGELPQCFCRLCAVFGGVYCLRRSVDAWILDADGNCTGIVSDGHRVTCRRMVTEGSYMPKELLRNLSTSQDVISRAILITDRPLTKLDGRENVSLLNYFADHLPEPVKILESGAAGCVCPNNLYIIQMTTKGKSNSCAKDDLEPIVQKFFVYGDHPNEPESKGDERPRVLWSVFFNCTSINLSGQVENNIAVVPPLDGQLTYAELVPRLKEEFTRLWPDTEFLPAPPNPDDSDAQETVPSDPGVNGYTPDAF